MIVGSYKILSKRRVKRKAGMFMEFFNIEMQDLLARTKREAKQYCKEMNAARPDMHYYPVKLNLNGKKKWFIGAERRNK